MSHPHGGREQGERDEGGRRAERKAERKAEQGAARPPLRNTRPARPLPAQLEPGAGVSPARRWSASLGRGTQAESRVLAGTGPDEEPKERHRFTARNLPRDSHPVKYVGNLIFLQPRSNKAKCSPSALTYPSRHLFPR